MKPKIPDSSPCERRLFINTDFSNTSSSSTSPLHQVAKSFQLQQQDQNLMEEEQHGPPPQTKKQYRCRRHMLEGQLSRPADQAKMDQIQQEISGLTLIQKQTVSTVWSLFSAAPASQRELMLKGIVSKCCSSQMALLSTEVQDQLKVDFLSVLPTELALRVLTYLDTVSLCKAAQVSRKWNQLADSEYVWRHMCKQHIDNKCTECGWGLPPLKRNLLRQSLVPGVDLKKNKKKKIKRSRPMSAISSGIGDELVLPTAKRVRRENDDDSWKDTYRRGWAVGSNWKWGRFSPKTLRGHSDSVTCLKINAEENILASGSYDATIRLWDITTAREIRCLKGHSSGIRDLCFDGDRLFSASLDGTVRAWDWSTGKKMYALSHDGNAVLSVDCHDGILVSGSSTDAMIRAWNFTSMQTFCLRGHTNFVNQVRWDSKSRTVLSASDDFTVRLWNLDSRACIRIFTGHNNLVQQVLALPDSFRLPSSSSSCRRSTRDAEVRGTASVNSVKDEKSSMADSTSNSEEDSIGDVTGDKEETAESAEPLPPPARYILSGSLDQTVKLWDTTNGHCLNTWFGHLEGIWGLAGNHLKVVTGSHDGTVKLWDPQTGKCVRTFTGHTDTVTCVGLTDVIMASGSDDRLINLYSFE